MIQSVLERKRERESRSCGSEEREARVGAPLPTDITKVWY